MAAQLKAAPLVAAAPVVPAATAEVERKFREEFLAATNSTARTDLVRDYGWKTYRVGQVAGIPEREVAAYFTGVVAGLINENPDRFEAYGLAMGIPNDVFDRARLVETLKPALWELVQSGSKATVTKFEASQRAIRDFEEAKAHAEAGNVKGMINLAAFYRDGYGTNQNPAEAERWARLAAERQQARAARSAGAPATGGAPEGTKIGSFWEGGIVIELDGTGRHGLTLALTQTGSVSYPRDTPERAQGSGPFSDWYIPTLEEWKRVHANRRVIERALQAARGAPLDGRYWTSTAVSYNTARGVLVANRWSIFPLSGEASESTVDTELCQLRLIRSF